MWLACRLAMVALLLGGAIVVATFGLMIAWDNRRQLG